MVYSQTFNSESPVFKCEKVALHNLLIKLRNASLRRLNNYPFEQFTTVGNIERFTFILTHFRRTTVSYKEFELHCC